MLPWRRVNMMRPDIKILFAAILILAFLVPGYGLAGFIPAMRTLGQMISKFEHRFFRQLILQIFFYIFPA